MDLSGRTGNIGLSLHSANCIAIPNRDVRLGSGLSAEIKAFFNKFLVALKLWEVRSKSRSLPSVKILFHSFELFVGQLKRWFAEY